MTDANALASMKTALRRRCVAIQRLLAKAAVDEVDTRYEIGSIVRSIEDAGNAYGERSVERVASALGISAATLYRYSAVARAWPASEMRTLSRRRNANGEPLSWSHWVELTRAPKTWSRWVDQALEGCWSARRLARELDAEVGGPNESGLPEDTTRAALMEALKEAQHWNSQVKVFGAALDRLARSSRHPPEIEELLARALDLFGDAFRRTGDVVARVREMAPPKGLKEVRVAS